MAHQNHPFDPNVEDLLASLTDVPDRNRQAASEGRARFLGQARDLAQGVSGESKRRHIGWNQNLLERITQFMKPRTVLSSILTIVALFAAAAVFMVRNVTSVSAQQILEQASAAQSAQSASQGIQHYRIEIYNNPQAQAGAETLEVTEEYEDWTSHLFRVVTTDASGQITSAFSIDGAYLYDLKPEDVRGSDGSMVISRTEDNRPAEKRTQSIDPEAQTRALFEQFRNNPRVRLKGKQTWADGRQVYVLVDDNYQTQKQPDGQEQKTYTGTMKMVFDVKTLQLVFSEITLRKGDQDVVLNSVKYLVNEVLPAGSSVAWDLSDLKGVSYVDEPSAPEVPVDFEVLSVEELTARTSAYLLNPLPEGFSLEIVAATNQPKDQPYAYETNYTTSDGKEFDLQAIGATDMDFINNNFYDGSYQAANGLELYYSTSSTEKSTSAIMTTPDGKSYLLYGSFPREEVEDLVEDLVPAP